MPGKLIIPNISEQEALRNPIPKDQFVVIRETGKTYRGDGVKTVDLLAEVNAFEVQVLETRDATPVSFESVPISDNTCGILEVRLSASDSADCLHGVKFIGYQKLGTLSIVGTIQNIMPDQGALAVSWTVTIDADNNFSVDITGIALTTISWKIFYKITSLAVTPP